MKNKLIALSPGRMPYPKFVFSHLRNYVKTKDAHGLQAFLKGQLTGTTIDRNGKMIIHPINRHDLAFVLNTDQQLLKDVFKLISAAKFYRETPPLLTAEYLFKLIQNLDFINPFPTETFAWANTD